jgi:tetratricopeptide (TPR) repeat protein
LWVPSHNFRVSRQWMDQSAGTLREARRSLEQSLALAADTQPTPALEAARARALYALGRVLVSEWDGGDDQRVAATRAFEQGLALYRRLNDRQGTADCLFWLGGALFDQEELRRARDAFEESLDLSRALGVPNSVGWALLGVGRIALREGDNEFAQAVLEECVEQQHMAGNALGVAGALDALGQVGVAQGNYANAIRYHGQALEVRRSLGAQSGVVRSLYQLAVMINASGDVPRAASLLLESLELGRRIRNPWDIMVSLIALGSLVGTTGSPELGARLIGAGQALEHTKGLQVPVTYQGMYRRTLRFIERQLGEEAFAAHQAAGMALSMDEAIAEALQVAERV